MTTLGTLDCRPGGKGRETLRWMADQFKGDRMMRGLLKDCVVEIRVTQDLTGLHMELVCDNPMTATSLNRNCQGRLGDAIRKGYAEQMGDDIQTVAAISA
jgi:hypothetical protein